MIFRKLPLIILLTFSTFTAGLAQNDTCDMKVGLVLSGGGAKCIAQIGALYVIDSLGIKVDYISGTSMGAVIGSMYALGYPVKAIEKYMRQIDWDALLSNEIPRNRLSYFDRKTEDRYLLTFPILDGKIQLPTALNYAQYILKQLSYLGQQSYHYATFKDFPIPFLCVATNLETGKLEVFQDGRLLDALRASSAFPSLFTPYHLNGNLYVDGGVINNYPVEPLKERGMDYIIGVDVQDFLYKKSDLNSVVHILEQTSSFTNARAHGEQLAMTDCYIKPDLPYAGITSFELFDSLVAAGKEAARKHISELLALKAYDTTTHIQKPAYPALPMDKFYVSDIKIYGNNNSGKAFILGKLRLSKGDTCSTLSLNRGIDRLYGSHYFENIDYTLTPLDTGYQLNLNVRENKSLSMFRIGLHYDDDFKTALLLNYTKRNLFFKNSRLSADIAVGDNPRLNLHYFVDRGLIPTIGYKFRMNRFKTRIYQNGDPITQLTMFDFANSLFIQSTFEDQLALGGGIELEGVQLSQDISVISDSDTYRNYLNYYGFIDFDSFNRANYPSRGTKINGSVKLISRQENFKKFYEPSEVVEASISQAYQLFPRLTFTSTLFGASTIGPDLDYPFSIFLGGLGKNYINYIYPFVGYRFMELAVRNVAVFRTDVYFQFAKHHYLVLRGNVGKSGKALDNLFSSDVLLDGYSIGYSFDSPIGPLEFNLMGSTNHKGVYTYINLGYWF